MSTLIFDHLTQGERARLTRIALGWRQIELASWAKVSIIEVTRLEKDKYVRPIHLNYMLYWLDMPLYVHEHTTIEEVEDYVKQKFGDEKQRYWESKEKEKDRFIPPGF